jgi:hypothetical protein
VTAATQYLFDVGTSILFAGFNLSVALFLVAWFRDPDPFQVIAWSLRTQWTATGRILRRAAGFRWWGVLAKLLVTLGVACLLLSGLLAVITLFVNGPKG